MTCLEVGSPGFSNSSPKNLIVFQLCDSNLKRKNLPVEKSELKFV